MCTICILNAYSVLTKWIYTCQPVWNSENHIFQPGDLDLWPITLAIQLVRDVIKVNPDTKFLVPTSSGSAVRVLADGQTEWHTDGTDFIPSTADAGGNKVIVYWILHITTWVSPPSSSFIIQKPTSWPMLAWYNVHYMISDSAWVADWTIWFSLYISSYA